MMMLDLKRTALGLELGSTRIKAVLIDENHFPVASGSHEWENALVDGVWTYSMEAVSAGVKDCFADLMRDVREKYGMELLKAGASIGDMTPADIAKNDNKEFQIGDYRILVSQISVMDLEDALKMKAELLESMNALCSSEKYDMCLLMVTDILQESTELLYVGSPKPLIGMAFKKDASGDSIFLPGVMSRKKQIIPPLTEAVKRLQK